MMTGAEKIIRLIYIQKNPLSTSKIALLLKMQNSNAASFLTIIYKAIGEHTPNPIIKRTKFNNQKRPYVYSLACTAPAHVETAVREFNRRKGDVYRDVRYKALGRQTTIKTELPIVPEDSFTKTVKNTKVFLLQRIQTEHDTSQAIIDYKSFCDTI